MAQDGFVPVLKEMKGNWNLTTCTKRRQGSSTFGNMRFPSKIWPMLSTPSFMSHHPLRLIRRLLWPKSLRIERVPDVEAPRIPSLKSTTGRFNETCMI